MTPKDLAKAVLRKLADAAARYEGTPGLIHYGDSCELWQLEANPGMRVDFLTVGDLRKAAHALALLEAEGVTEDEAMAGGRWYAGEDIDRMVKQLDVAMNGEGGAEQPRLCDIQRQLLERVALEAEGADGWRPTMTDAREAVRAWIADDLSLGAGMSIGYHYPALRARLDALALPPSPALADDQEDHSAVARPSALASRNQQPASDLEKG